VIHTQVKLDRVEKHSLASQYSLLELLVLWAGSFEHRAAAVPHLVARF
jgi:hypothetical protein